MNAISTEHIASLRAALWQNGWRPLSLYTGDKRPFGTDWGTRARRDPPDAVTSPVHPTATNTGILCDGLRALDIDIDDEEAATALEALAVQHFGETLVRYRANSARRLLVYRAAVGQPVKQTLAGELGKLELLGKGQQFHSHGLHPSGATLLWRPAPPEAMSRHNLPEITESALATFLKAAAPMVRSCLPASPTPRPTRCGSPPPITSNRMLAGLVSWCATAPEGERNNRLFWAACRAGEGIRQDKLTEASARALLEPAGLAAGLSAHAVSATIESGLRHGLGGVQNAR